MPTSEQLRLNSITREVVDAAIFVHRELGPGLMESVYETALAHELRKRGLHVARQQSIPVVVNGEKLDDGFRCDLLVERDVIVEL